MINHEEVDIEKAVSIGSNDDNSSTFDNDADNNRQVAIEMLMSLPGNKFNIILYLLNFYFIIDFFIGINNNNYHVIMNNVESISDLSSMSINLLTPLIGQLNAKKLFAFFHQRTIH